MEFAAFLMSKGYLDVYCLNGGYEEWRKTCKRKVEGGSRTGKGEEREVMDKQNK